MVIFTVRDIKDITVIYCPHCNSDAFLAWYGGGYYRVRCKNGKCAACGGSSPDPVEAANLWNKREGRERLKQQWHKDSKWPEN